MGRCWCHQIVQEEQPKELPQLLHRPQLCQSHQEVQQRLLDLWGHNTKVGYRAHMHKIKAHRLVGFDRYG
ncbi:hypothetical protein GCM10010971_41360 [Silvimonas amylolytica]|uniref:Uncharacterized protein n=1 Tax=Silvimonas amylolytica TaxID=449663 RepID=A0ABQ2PRP7_9NEIS|nr:hypothetical protein GCM10010971_41360 [Silvimonas amylolytica]